MYDKLNIRSLAIHSCLATQFCEEQKIESRESCEKFLHILNMFWPTSYSRKERIADLESMEVYDKNS